MPQWQEPGEYLGNARAGQVHVVSPDRSGACTFANEQF